MWPLLLLKNPLARKAGAALLVLALIGYLGWRVHYLSARAQAQQAELVRYERSFKEMARINELRAEVTAADTTRALGDERARADVLMNIGVGDATIDGPVAAVLSRTVARLYGDSGP